MTFTRFVQIGRVGMINYGSDEGKLCTILDVVDQTTVLVDGPADVTGVQRQLISLKRIALTDFVLPVLRQAREKTLRKIVAEEDLMGKWEQTAWAKKRAVRAARAATTDFDRFKIMIAKKRRARIVRKQLASMRK